MVFVLLERRMDTKPQKPPLLFANPLSLWTELAFKFWGFGQAPAESSPPEKKAAVGVIPTSDAQPRTPKRTKAKVRTKRSKRARR